MATVPVAVFCGVLSTTTSVTARPGRAIRIAVRSGSKLSFAHATTGIVLLALVVRVAVVLGTPHFATIDDSATYDRMALSVARHGVLPSSQIPPTGGPTAYPPPLFSIVLAGAYKVVGVGSAHTRWEAGRMLEAVLGAIAVALICLIAARLFGRRVGLLSGAIAAVYPPLVLIGSSLMSESLFVPLVLGAVLAGLVHRDSGTAASALAAGVLVALAALTHSNGIVLLLGVVLLVWRGPLRASWRSVRGPVLVVLATAVTLAPWAIRNAAEFHEFVPITTETGYAIAGTYNPAAQHRDPYPALWTAPIADIEQLLRRNPRLNEAGISDGLVRLGLDYAKAHPSYVLSVVGWSALRLFNLAGPGFERWEAQWEGYPPTLASVSVFAFWALGLLAVAGMFTAGVRRVPWSLWSCPVLILLSTLPFAGLTRYRSPADPFLIMLAALTLASAWGRVRRTRALTAGAGRPPAR